MIRHIPIIGAGGGGKGGGGNVATQSAPQEHPDTLFSRSFVDVIYMVGEGPIYGLVFGPKSLYIDGVPAINANGSANFNGVEFAQNVGYPNQLPLSWETVAAEEHSVGVEVQQATPWTVRITDPNVDAVVVTIGFPQMAEQLKDSGEVVGAKVELGFYLQANNAGYVLQNVGYGPVAGIKHSQTLIQAASLAYDCTFFVRASGDYAKVNASVSIDGSSWFPYGTMELFADYDTGTCLAHGVVSWSGGGLFFVMLTPVSGESDVRFESFNFLGLSGNHQVNGKCLQRYQQQIRVTLYGSPPWDVRVVRNTPDSTSASLANQTWVDGYRTEITTKLRYPYTAVYSVRLPADQFSSIPKVEFDIFGVVCNIPNNYNPFTRTYSGVWDGNFTTAWTMNPAWCLWNLLSHTRYGLGDHLIPIDKYAFYSLAQYCDEPIPDGKGGLIARFECHLSIDSFAEAYDWIQTMCAVFRGMLYVIDGYGVAVADRPGDPAYLFNNSNVVDGRFAYSGSATTAIHTAIYVTYLDFDANGEQTVEYVPDPQLISRYGYNPQRVTALWCRRKRHARLIGEWILETERNCTDVVSFSPSSAEAAFLRPGDIIYVADENRSGERRGGRILSNTTTTITTDAPVEIYGNTTNSLQLIGFDGSVVTREITNSPGWTSEITFAPEIANDPVDFAVWLIISPGRIEPQQFRIVEIEEKDDGTATLTALEHNPAIFNHIERDIPMLPHPVYSVRPGVQSPPENVTASEAMYLTRDGTVQVRLSVAWNQAPSAVNYAVRFRRGAGNWKSGGTSSDTLWELDNALPGRYEIVVTAVNALGKRSQGASTDILVRGKTAPPPKVSVFRIVSLKDGKRRAVFRYRNPPLDLRGFQIRYGRGVKTAGQWGSMIPLHTGVLRTSPFEFTLAGTGTYTFAVVGVDTSGNRSAVPFFRQVQMQAPALVDSVLILSRSAGELGFPGETVYGAGGAPPPTEQITWNDAGTWDTAGTWSVASDYTWDTPATWDEMPNWLGIVFESPCVYTDIPIDLGARLQCYAMIDAETDGDAMIELRTSQDGVTWSAWRDPALMIDARWVQVRVTVTTEAGVDPTPSDLTTVIATTVVDKVFADIDTTAMATRYGVGDVRVPMPGFLYIESVAVTVRSPSMAVTATVVDKDPSGSRIRFFDAAGLATEAICDLRVRGY